MRQLKSLLHKSVRKESCELTVHNKPVFRKISVQAHQVAGPGQEQPQQVWQCPLGQPGLQWWDTAGVEIFTHFLWVYSWVKALMCFFPRWAAGSGAVFDCQLLPEQTAFQCSAQCSRSWCPVAGPEAQTETREAPSEQQGTLFHWGWLSTGTGSI